MLSVIDSHIEDVMPVVHKDTDQLDGAPEQQVKEEPVFVFLIDRQSDPRYSGRQSRPNA
jgi:hypothetical protein